MRIPGSPPLRRGEREHREAQPMNPLRSILLAAVLALALLLAASASSASAAVLWRVVSQHGPTHVAPNDDVEFALVVQNVGDAEANGDTDGDGVVDDPITITDTLPAGLTASDFRSGIDFNSSAPWDCSATDFSAAPTVVTCTAPFGVAAPAVGPGSSLNQRGMAPVLYIDAKADGSPHPVGENRVVLSGGGAGGPALADDPVTFSPVPAGFGLDGFLADAFTGPSEGAAVVRQAGAHPGELRFDLDFDLKATHDPELGLFTEPDHRLKRVDTTLPLGFIGNPLAAPTCPQELMNKLAPGATGGFPLCPAASQVGTVDLLTEAGKQMLGVDQPNATQQLPVYNVEPRSGELAELGFVIQTAVVHIDISLDPTDGYAVHATIDDSPTLVPVRSAHLTLWGVPTEASHDALRFHPSATGSPLDNYYGATDNEPSRPFLTLPSQCDTPGFTAMTLRSWTEPENPFSIQSPPVRETGCEDQKFTGTLSAQPTETSASSPSGLAVDLSIPQNEQVPGLGTPPLRKVTLRLPVGVAVNPSSAGGLQACSEAEIGLGANNPVGCPDASRIGTVELQTPVLADAVHGSLFLAAQGANPFGSLIALYLVLEDHERGLLVKLAGRGALDPVTGQISTTFDESPQLPFSHLHVQLKSGPRAPLRTPEVCGAYRTTAELTSWNSMLPVVVAGDSFNITSGPGGGSCAAPGFAPSFAAGSASAQAGAFASFTTTLSRGDGDQRFAGVQVRTPPGLSGIIKGVPECPEAQANAGTCDASSLVGHATVGAGSGSNPFYVQSGEVFFTGPYKGAPFGLSIVVPAVAGPFNLGTVVVRAAISVDPNTAQLTVTSEPFPTILQGIPLDIRSVTVSIDRSGFALNPTGCEPSSVNATVASTHGASATVSSPFNIANCAALPFAPRFTVSVSGHASRANGVAFDAKLVIPARGQSDPHVVKVALPKQLPSRSATLKRACLAAVFEANPAACPAASVVGSATARTPVLPVAVTGPAYLISHGGQAFPDLVIVLQGDGVRLDLVGNTRIKNAITTSTFASAPDVPVETFELKLPAGPHSLLTTFVPARANYSLCATKLVLPTQMTAYNGRQVNQNTKLTVTGCTTTKAKHATKHTARKTRRAGSSRIHVNRVSGGASRTGKTR
jgi:hypothetical protein